MEFDRDSAILRDYQRQNLLDIGGVGVGNKEKKSVQIWTCNSNPKRERFIRDNPLKKFNVLFVINANQYLDAYIYRHKTADLELKICIFHVILRLTCFTKGWVAVVLVVLVCWCDNHNKNLPFLEGHNQSRNFMFNTAKRLKTVTLLGLLFFVENAMMIVVVVLVVPNAIKFRRTSSYQLDWIISPFFSRVCYFAI